MSGEILRLVPDAELCTGEVSAEAVEVLEALLEEARAGKIRAVAMAVVRPDRTFSTSYNNSDAYTALLAAVTVLQHRLVAEIP